MNIGQSKAKPTFGGHEKFVFRQGWLKKGVDAVSDNPTVFADDKALVTLGVGKNMVRSIRHWCLAIGLLEESPVSDRSHPLRVTALGEQLFRLPPWDPYMEDAGTIWLLHWQLATNRHRSLVWHLIISRYYDTEFTKRQLVSFVAKQFEHIGVNTTTGTIDREVDCFLRTYVSTVRTRNSNFSEENLDCPLVELDLIRYSQEDNLYNFNVGPKASLPTAIFGFGLIYFLDTIAKNRRTVHVDECIYNEGSPGQIFRLDENSVIEHLESLEEITDGALRLQESAGLPQVYLNELSEESWPLLSTRLLKNYYERH
jgi:hypothetical protein